MKLCFHYDSSIFFLDYGFPAMTGYGTGRIITAVVAGVNALLISGAAHVSGG